MITTAVPDTFVPPGQEPLGPKGFWEAFMGKDPNKGKVCKHLSPTHEARMSLVDRLVDLNPDVFPPSPPQPQILSLIHI